jgi:hypothetical protein
MRMMKIKILTLCIVFLAFIYPVTAYEEVIIINDLSCKLINSEVNIDLWHASIVGNAMIELNNTGDTDVSIKYDQKEIIVPKNGMKSYKIDFELNLLSRKVLYRYVAEK